MPKKWKRKKIHKASEVENKIEEIKMNEKRRMLLWNGEIYDGVDGSSTNDTKVYFFWFGVLFIFPNNWVHSLEFVPAFNQRIVSSSNIEFDTILGSFSVLLIYSEPQKLSAI